MSIKFPKSVLNKDTNTSGIKYNASQNAINIVNNPISLVLFSSFIKFLIFGNFIYYSIIFYNLIIYMRKSKKNKTMKKSSKSNKKCIYTDEAKRIIKATKTIKQMNKKLMKNIKPK